DGWEIFVARQFRSQSMLPETEPGSMSVADLVADEAARVGQSAKDAGDRVARTAAGQAREVAAETTHQAWDLLEQGRQQLREQAAFQQEKVALRLATVADELREMAHSSKSDPVSELARHGAESLDQLASWVRDHQAGELLEQARRFARRRPGVFLLGAALAGVVAGRLTSSGVAAVKQSDDTGSAPQGAADSGYGPAAAQPAVVRPRTSPENPSGQAGSGMAYPAPPSPQPPVGSAPQTRSPRGAFDAGVSPYPTSRDATTSVPPRGGDRR
ncbi:MAG: hypothetical protein LC721_06310, partial [Actinobacteria bacterium]|nr:hypothetical protein [Actinomycetota bacterium]